MSVKRLLVVGLDGLEPSLVERWIGEGRLPHLAALRESGRFGPLESTLPYATFPAWTSFLTGVNPGSHGIFDFARQVPGRYEVEFIGARARRRPSLARLVSDAGLRVASLGFPGTWPPEPVSGVMIAGFDAPVAVGADASFMYPAEVGRALEARWGRWPFADFAETRSWVPGWHRRAARRLMSGLRRRGRITRAVLGQEAWDVFMVHFGESDTAAHHFWAFHDAASPRRPAGIDASLGDVLGSIYAALDAEVGALVRAMEPGCHVLIASDHGFGGSGDKALYLNRWLASQGWLGFEASPGLGQRAFGLGVRAGLALAPGRVQERLWRLAGPWAGRAEARRRYAGIDWAQTAVYSDELSYNPTLRLNVRGRDPQGIVPPEDVDGWCARVTDALRALRDPWTGQPVVAEVWRREALYQGEAVPESPELVLDLALDGEYTYNLLTSGGPGPIWRRLEPGELLGAKGAGMNGTHRREGFWLVAGPRVIPRRRRARMVDMAPTALAALDLAPAPWMEGVSHLATAEAPRPIQTAAGAIQADAPAYTAAQQAIVEDRLRRLGYL